MFDEKSYMWFLGELFKSKLKLKILDIAFCKADHIEVIYFTDNDGTVSVAPNRSLLIRVHQANSVRDILLIKENLLLKRRAGDNP